jgi:hypothetical protein
MRIQFLTSLVGFKISYKAGDVADIDDAEAKRLVDAGFAIVEPTPDAIETATAPQPVLEQAVVQTKKTRKPKVAS